MPLQKVEASRDEKKLSQRVHAFVVIATRGKKKSQKLVSQISLVVIDKVSFAFSLVVLLVLCLMRLIPIFFVVERF